MTPVVNVNGRITAEADAVVSVLDHGFLFGDGVYEVLRTYHRRPFLFAEHMARLRTSAELISLAVPFRDEELLARVEETIEAAGGTGEAYVRVLLTRGVGDLVYDPEACPTPTLVVIVRPLAASPATVYERGVAISLVPVVRNHRRALNPRIKSNNLLNNALAIQAARRRGGFEALMTNVEGELVECAQSNFFLVRGGEALTPPVEAGLLPGITRAFVFRLAPDAGVTVREATLYPADLAGADEAFITSTTREIVPVVRVDDRVIGDGRPGPVTRRLIEAFHAGVEESLRDVLGTGA